MTELDHPLEFLPELALGVLAEEDAPGVREHLAGCEPCRGEYEVMTAAARLLPFAVEAVEPNPAIRESLMQRIASEPRAIRPRVIRPVWQRFAAIAAAAALLVVVGGFAGSLLTTSDGDLKHENARQGALVQAVAEGTARRDSFQDGAMVANVVYAPGTRSAFALMAGLPELPKGKAYQAWFISDAGALPSNVFSEAEEGVWLESPGDVTTFGALGITIEDDEGADEPSQPPFMIVDLNRTAGAYERFTIKDWLALTIRD